VRAARREPAARGVRRRARRVLLRGPRHDADAPGGPLGPPPRAALLRVAGDAGARVRVQPLDVAAAAEGAVAPHGGAVHGGLWRGRPPADEPARDAVRPLPRPRPPLRPARARAGRDAAGPP